MTESNQNQDKETENQELHPEIEHWLKALQKADDTFYNLMSIELWAITQTMDDMAPGFWSQYMQTRQEVMQQYLQEKRSKNTENLEPNLSHNSNPLRHSPLWQSEESEKIEAKIDEISIYSKSLDSEWLTDIESSHNSLELESINNNLELSEDIDNNIPENTPPIVKNNPNKNPYISKSIGISINDNIEDNLTTTVSVTPLPHLVRQPVIKQVKNSPELPEQEGLISMAIACCLTKHFLVAWPDKQAKISWVLKRLDAITLTPGQSIICLLGFQLNKINSSIGIQLVKRLRSYTGLNVAIVSSIKEIGRAHV